jgi:D-alanine transaminase
VLAYLNGQYQPRVATTISVEDRGFVFGDGVYEVWRVVNGRLFETERHLERLRFGLREVRIDEPAIVVAGALDEIADHLLSESGLTTGEATLYVEITRGAAPRTHQFPPAGTTPTVFVTVNRFTPPEALRTRGASAITLPDTRWLRCDIKTLQLLPNVMAKQAAVEVGAVDALFIRDGVVTESSHANVIGVLDGVIRTHPTNHLILPGITRGIVLDIARDAGMTVAAEPIAAADVHRLDELFLAGTTTDVMPIVRVNDHKIGTGVPGPVSRRLQEAFRARLDSACSGTARRDVVPAPA